MKRGVFIKMDKIKSFNYKLDDFFQRNKSVSYTHLDVYKRQREMR